jgi:hypothetical protein
MRKPLFLESSSKVEEKGKKEWVISRYTGWKRLLNAETSLQHATF